MNVRLWREPEPVSVLERCWWLLGDFVEACAIMVLAGLLGGRPHVDWRDG